MDTHRHILHVDMNCFYASVEMAEEPRLRGKPVIVGGDEEARHGIVLTASYPAKRRGVKTAMTLNEARRVCPEAIIVPPQYGLYISYSRHARQIYNQYTDLVEPFGLDEAWLDITNSPRLASSTPEGIAREIASRIPQELGCTVSIGLSWNKIFAKFGSDYRKPNGFTIVSPEAVPQIVWPSKVQELLYVGPATRRKLNRNGIFTVGQLALADDYAVKRLLGKMGEVVQAFARGLDTAPVRPYEPGIGDIAHEIKGIGNGITTPFDVEDERTARQVIWLMGESVAQRLRAHGLAARTISVWARDAETLGGSSRQMTLERPTQITGEICTAAAVLACAHVDFAHGEKVRALGVRASNLSPASTWVQLDVFGEETRRQRMLDLDKTIDKLRLRFGNHAVRHLSELANPHLAEIDAERDNVVHPVSFFA